MSETAWVIGGGIVTVALVSALMGWALAEYRRLMAASSPRPADRMPPSTPTSPADPPDAGETLR